VRSSDAGSAPAKDATASSPSTATDAAIAPAQPNAAGSAEADATMPVEGLGCDSLTIPWSWSPSFDRCAINLTPAADPADKLSLVVTEGDTRENVPHDVGDGAGWTISVDGAHVELVGALCGAARDGRFSSIRFQFGCAQHYPPLPPSHLL